MVLLFTSVMINYLDRSNLSITAPAMRAELGLDTAQMGYVLSAFGWTYALCQIPGGWLVDRVAPRVLYATLIVLWSIATIALGFTTTVAGLIAGAPARRRAGGAVVSDQQSRRDDLVSGARARDGDRRSTRRDSTSASRS